MLPICVPGAPSRPDTGHTPEFCAVGRHVSAAPQAHTAPTTHQHSSLNGKVIAQHGALAGARSFSLYVAA